MTFSRATSILLLLLVCKGHAKYDKKADLLIKRRMGSDDAPCTNQRQEYLEHLHSNIDPEVLNLVHDLKLHKLPQYYRLLVNTVESDDEYFGTFGEDTTDIIEANHILEAFWGAADDNGGSAIVTNNIQLVGLHGADMKDRNILISTLELLYDLTNSDTVEKLYDLTGTRFNALSDLADFIQTLIVEKIPHEYDNPIFTFTAYAAPRFEDDDGTVYAAQIGIGDGIIEYFQFKNLGYHGPDVALGHEWGHQMQYAAEIEKDIDDLPTNLDTRRYELMADAFGGYFLAHRNGGNIQGWRILDLSKAAIVIGDCDVENKKHHGTPPQRECAMTWGINRALSNGKKILHPDELQVMFDNDLPAIIDLEKSVCKLSDTQ